MKQFYLKLAVGCLAIVAFLALLGWAGNIDYTEQCILHMSYEEYDTIRQRLTITFGHEPSQRDIANWWAKHHKD